MPSKLLIAAELDSYAATFDNSYEDAAVSGRGEFLRAFPASRLSKISLDDYAIGKGTASFCARVEAKTRAWANIQGATANKFGIYFGRTKSDPKRKYRFTKKFGETEAQAFSAVKAALLDLLRAGEAKDFVAVDGNPLSQMFKAKILSLYFPDNYLNVCSAEHLELIAGELGLPADRPSSEYQHLLIEEKSGNPTAKTWSNPKFMSFLYAKFVTGDFEPSTKIKVRKPRGKAKRKVNFDELQANRDRIGKLSENFALEWEKDRLSGLGLEQLVPRIIDRRDYPSCGFDFQSHSALGLERYIEVKSLGFDRKEKSYRFFLSENERDVSLSIGQRNGYYFYLVLFGKDGKPRDLVAKHAAALYSDCDVSPCAYIVRLEVDEHQQRKAKK